MLWPWPSSSFKAARGRAKRRRPLEPEVTPPPWAAGVTWAAKPGARVAAESSEQGGLQARGAPAREALAKVDLDRVALARAALVEPWCSGPHAGAPDKSAARATLARTAAAAPPTCALPTAPRAFPCREPAAPARATRAPAAGPASPVARPEPARPQAIAVPLAPSARLAFALCAATTPVIPVA